MYLQLICLPVQIGDNYEKLKAIRKHLTFEQRVDIEKGLTENKASLKLDELLVKIHLLYQRKYVSTHIQKNVRIQVTLTRHVFIVRTVR